MGSSSTLINNLATWAEVNPYELLAKTFSGSGYDLACAKHSNPILFQLQKNKNPFVEEVEFSPKFKDELFFVHLNQKQNSREGIQHYRQQDLAKRQDWIKKVNRITAEILKAKPTVIKTMPKTAPVLDSTKFSEITSKLVEPVNP